MHRPSGLRRRFYLNAPSLLDVSGETPPCMLRTACCSLDAAHCLPSNPGTGTAGFNRCLYWSIWCRMSSRGPAGTLTSCSALLITRVEVGLGSGPVNTGAVANSQTHLSPPPPTTHTLKAPRAPVVPQHDRVVCQLPFPQVFLVLLRKVGGCSEG